MPHGIKEEHPSFGMIGITRVSTNKPIDLFGSPLKHGNFIQLSIQGAVRERSLSNDWYFARNTKIEIAMSETQFARFITSANIGDGVPCTLNYFDGKKIDACPPNEMTAAFKQEVNDDLEKLRDQTNEFQESVKSLLDDKRIPKTVREELAKKAEAIHAKVSDSVPFVVKQFHRRMDGVVNDAKTEFDAYVTKRVQDAGLQALNSAGSQDTLALPAHEIEAEIVSD